MSVGCWNFVLEKKKEREKGAPGLQATVVFSPLALMESSHLFNFLESTFKLFIPSFKGRQDFSIFLLTALSENIWGNLLFVGILCTSYGQISEILLVEPLGKGELN